MMGLARTHVRTQAHSAKVNRILRRCSGRRIMKICAHSLRVVRIERDDADWNC